MTSIALDDSAMAELESIRMKFHFGQVPVHRFAGQNVKKIEDIYYKCYTLYELAIDPEPYTVYKLNAARALLNTLTNLISSVEKNNNASPASR